MTPVPAGQHLRCDRTPTGSDSAARLRETSAQVEALIADAQDDLRVLLVEGDRCSTLLDGIVRHVVTAAADGELQRLIQAAGEEIAHTRGRSAAAKRRLELTAARMSELHRELDRRDGEMRSLRRALEQARKTLNIDPLTGVGNRRLYDQMVRRLAAEAVERHEDLVVLLADIDNFKRFNDTYGHAAGDAVLQLVARRLKGAVRACDVVARYGGEEFAVLVPRMTLVRAAALAERIRARICGERIRLEAGQRDLGVVTVSIGVASYHPGEPLAAFAERADQALYAAKRGGRDHVVVGD